MTVIGKDRPGLVESVASLVAKHGGNWLESRMCRLGGEFAGILRVVVDTGRQPALENELKAIAGLTIVICPDSAPAPTAAGRLVGLEVVGQDRPGIVREISHALARQGVNVEELSTQCTSAPMTGEALFKAQAKLQIPATCSLPNLRTELERIGGNLLVDVTLEELPLVRQG